MIDQREAISEKVVLIGGPSTGKSSVLSELENRGFHCFPEVSREVIIEAQKEGIDQLFLTEPLLFSEKLLEGREKQYQEAYALAPQLPELTRITLDALKEKYQYDTL